MDSGRTSGLPGRRQSAANPPQSKLRAAALPGRPVVAKRVASSATKAATPPLPSKRPTRPVANNPKPVRKPEKLREPVPPGLYQFAAEQLDAGFPPAVVERELVESGLSVNAARAVVMQVLEYGPPPPPRRAPRPGIPPRRRRRERNDDDANGPLHIILGIGLGILGIFITIISYNSAVHQGDASFKVPVGIIVWGGHPFPVRRDKNH